MRIHSDQSGQAELIAFGTAFAMFAGLAASWRFESTIANMLLLLPASAFLLWTCAIRIANQAYFEVDPSQDRIRAYQAALFGKRRLAIYKLSDFHGVVSFLDNAGPSKGIPQNAVELLAKREGKGLVIARLAPQRENKELLSLPAYGESEKALELRQFFAATCGLLDLGFAGYRHSREPLPPHTESQPSVKDPVAPKQASTRL